MYIYKLQSSKNWKQTNEIWDDTSIRKPSSGIIEESFPIWGEVCLQKSGAIDVVIVSNIKQWVSKYEQSCVIFWKADTTLWKWIIRTENKIAQIERQYRHGNS